MSIFASIADPASLDATVRARLEASLAYLVDKAGAELETDHAAFEPVSAALRQRQVHPGVFARYYDMVLALRAKRFAEAAELMHEIVALAAKPMAFAIVPLSPEELGDDFERFPRLMFAERPGASPALPPQGAFAAAAARLREARAIIAAVDPAIDREITGLASRIYVAVPNPQSPRPFAGVTSFMVWGATLVNCTAHQTVPLMAEVLVHEITHALLFGLAVADPLVLNSADEAYASPLRKDPRPMDGVFHATIVCARLVEFYRAWLASGVPVDTAFASSRMADLAFRFDDGHRLVGEYGRLSPAGRDVHALAAEAAAGQ